MIRFAQKKDIPRMGDLLTQVNLVHYEGRPDIFKKARKYTDEELEVILTDPERPILVWTDEADIAQGYAFCIFQQHKDSHLLTDIKTLYIDDLCVDESMRGMHVGRALFEAVKAFAKEQGCYNLTLNVWSCNASALRFYEKCGLIPQKIGMETIL